MLFDSIDLLALFGVYAGIILDSYQSVLPREVDHIASSRIWPWFKVIGPQMDLSTLNMINFTVFFVP